MAHWAGRDVAPRDASDLHQRSGHSPTAALGTNEARRDQRGRRGALVRDLRAEGAAEWSIRGIVGALGRVYRHATNRLGWLGTNPTTLLGNGERPNTSATTDGGSTRRRTRATLAAAIGADADAVRPRRGDRRPALRATWTDLGGSRPWRHHAAAVRIEAQVDRSGERQPSRQPRADARSRCHRASRPRSSATSSRVASRLHQPSSSRPDPAARSASATSYGRSGRRRRVP